MTTEPAPHRRLKFFGPADLGNYFQAGRAAEVLSRFDASVTTYTASDVLELYNSRLFVENGYFPASSSEEQRAAFKALIPGLHEVESKFFGSLTDETLSCRIAGVSHEYHADLLELLSRHKVYSRCSAASVLAILDSLNVSTGTMLSCGSLVRVYDEEIRTRLVSNVANAEHVIRLYLSGDDRSQMYLPQSLKSSDKRALLDAYIDSEEAHPNLLELISVARVNAAAGIDEKMKLKAKRKHERWTKEFFESSGGGMVIGCDVTVTKGQDEPVEASRDGLVTKYSYSREWFDENLDYPTILNNFLYVFGFVDRHMLLTLPSCQAELGAIERVMGTLGKDAYPAGFAFRLKEQSSFLQVSMYERLLRHNDVELESVIAWFFADYLRDSFGVTNLRFAPSSRTATYLEKSRHLFAEMESIVMQFSLYVENGEFDPELLAMMSAQVKYRDVPSCLVGKYVYVGESPNIHNVMHLLFSDQSGFGYINESLRADNGARLLIEHDVFYGDFHDYQKDQVDYLIAHGVAENAGGHIRLASADQFVVLRDLYELEAASYYHHCKGAREAIDEMVTKGWLVRAESLLSKPEANYFNYCLNHQDFSDGLNLRNRYLHGAILDVADEEEHYRTYITALKLLVALVIKMNDDLWLRESEELANGTEATPSEQDC